MRLFACHSSFAVVCIRDFVADAGSCFNATTASSGVHFSVFVKSLSGQAFIGVSQGGVPTPLINLPSTTPRILQSVVHSEAETYTPA